MKKLITYGIIGLCILLAYLYPHAMLSPGELTEGHQKLNNNCTTCHNPFWGIANDKCIACHKLADIGKPRAGATDSSSAKKILFHQNFTNQACTVCHTDHKGRITPSSVGMFKHELLGETVVSQCITCHSKPADKIHAQIEGACSSCHSFKGWKSGVSFNHDMIQGKDKNNCAVCHQKPANAYHQQIKDNCDKCHNQSKWVPSTFDHSSYFVLNNNHNTTCATCHTTSNYAVYTCYGCHEHSESRISSKHLEEGIQNFSNCIACHKSGSEHEGGEHGGGGERGGDDD